MFRNITPVVKNLLIINIVVFLCQQLLRSADFTGIMSLWNIGSPNFKPYQFFTYMFAHSPGGLMHIIFNMLGLVFLGPLLERFWGSQRFLIFYMVTGIGAGVLYSGMILVQNSKVNERLDAFYSEPNPQNFNTLIVENPTITKFRPEVFDFIDVFDKHPTNQHYVQVAKNYAVDVRKVEIDFGKMLGASGAIYGILMAFGMLFPNTQMMLLFPPIPIKAKYLVLILGLYALYAGFSQNPNDQTAHFAHLGGMVFAFIMIKIWQSKRDSFY
jgi:membrane associated rhomboid family serine protease